MCIHTYHSSCTALVRCTRCNPRSGVRNCMYTLNSDSSSLNNQLRGNQTVINAVYVCVMCVCVCMYMYTHMHTYVYIYLYIYANKCICVHYIYKTPHHVHACMYTSTYLGLHARRHAGILAFVRKTDTYL